VTPVQRLAAVRPTARRQIRPTVVPGPRVSHAQGEEIMAQRAAVTIREADTIFREQGGWFDARWHFSFDRYRDPEHDSLGALRVFNDDLIVAGAEWPLHPHRDIESNTYVLSGRFLHADSLGNNGRLEAGGAQVMTFSHGGDLHSERNGSRDEPLRFIQFWILPSVRGLETRVQQRQYRLEDRVDRWLEIMGPTGTDGLELAQDAHALVSHLSDAGRLEHTVAPGRAGYLYVIDGRLSVDGNPVRTGDAVEISGEASLELSTTLAAELILIDVPLRFEPIGVWTGER
jgi:redox-sensitive bicupin YhaK (pirin superfamily)